MTRSPARRGGLGRALRGRGDGRSLSVLEQGTENRDATDPGQDRAPPAAYSSGRPAHQQQQDRADMVSRLAAVRDWQIRWLTREGVLGQVRLARLASHRCSRKQKALIMRHHALSDSPMSADHPRRDPTGLPEATPPALLELADGDDLHLQIGPVAKRLRGHHGADAGLQRLHPRADARSREGWRWSSTSPTTVTWRPPCTGTGCGSKRVRRLRTPTQRPIPVGGDPTRTGITFPDPACTGTTRTSAQTTGPEEMGLYGNLLVVPAAPATGRPLAGTSC